MRRLLLSLSVVPLFVVTGCADDSAERSPSRTSDVTEQGDEVELTRANFVEELSAAMLTAGTVELSWVNSIGDAEIAVSGWTVLSEDSAERAASLSIALPSTDTSEGPQMDLRMLDEVVYVNLGTSTSDGFSRMDTREDADAGGFSDLIDQVDPIRQLKVLQDSLTGFAEDGDGGDIDGVSTRRYLLTVDPAAMHAAQGLDAEALAEEAGSAEYVFYVGRDRLPRRMEVEIPSAGAATMEWRRWGQEPVIEMPDDDEITDGAR